MKRAAVVGHLLRVSGPWRMRVSATACRCAPSFAHVQFGHPFSTERERDRVPLHRVQAANNAFYEPLAGDGDERIWRMVEAVGGGRDHKVVRTFQEIESECAKTGGDIPVAAFNCLLLTAAMKGDSAAASDVLKRMKRSKVEPDINTALARVLIEAVSGDSAVTIEVLEAMLKQNVVPTWEFFGNLLTVAANNGDEGSFFHVLQLARACGRFPPALRLIAREGMMQLMRVSDTDVAVMEAWRDLTGDDIEERTEAVLHRDVVSKCKSGDIDGALRSFELLRAASDAQSESYKKAACTSIIHALGGEYNAARTLSDEMVHQDAELRSALLQNLVQRPGRSATEFFEFINEGRALFLPNYPAQWRVMARYFRAQGNEAENAVIWDLWRSSCTPPSSAQYHNALLEKVMLCDADGAYEVYREMLSTGMVPTREHMRLLFQSCCVPRGGFELTEEEMWEFQHSWFAAKRGFSYSQDSRYVLDKRLSLYVRDAEKFGITVDKELLDTIFSVFQFTRSTELAEALMRNLRAAYRVPSAGSQLTMVDGNVYESYLCAMYGSGPMDMHRILDDIAFFGFRNNLRPVFNQAMRMNRYLGPCMLIYNEMRLLGLEPDEHTFRIMLSKAVGVEVDVVMHLMQEGGVKRTPGMNFQILMAYARGRDSVVLENKYREMLESGEIVHCKEDLAGVVIGSLAKDGRVKEALHMLEEDVARLGCIRPHGLEALVRNAPGALRDRVTSCFERYEREIGRPLNIRSTGELKGPWQALLH